VSIHDRSLKSLRALKANTAPNMADIVVRSEATADIAAIYAHGAEQFGIETANSYHTGLQTAIERLAEFPQSGPIYPGLHPPIRFLTYRHHHVYYDYDGATVWIIRILHYAQDVGRVF
jgi:toxin ParE1/3/4